MRDVRRLRAKRAGRFSVKRSNGTFGQIFGDRFAKARLEKEEGYVCPLKSSGRLPVSANPIGKYKIHRGCLRALREVR